jgi:hypothetical protein
MLDPRHFFTAAFNETSIQSVSRLDHLIGYLATGNIPLHTNVPFQDILGTADEGCKCIGIPDSRCRARWNSRYSIRRTPNGEVCNKGTSGHINGWNVHEFCVYR